MHYAIVAWTDQNRVAKYAAFATRDEADAHVAEHGGFAVSDPAGRPATWLIDPAARTVADSPAEPTSEEVNAERDRRIAAGFVYGGKEYDTDQSSRENIAGAASLSLGALIADPNGDLGLRWADPDRDFSWTTRDNTEVAMTAAECQAFCQAAMQYKTMLIKTARTLKDLAPTPGDYANDRYWPSRTLD